MNELELIRSVVAHKNRNAYAFLVRQHQSALRGYLRRLCQGNEALALSYVTGFSNEEMAEILNCPLGTVKTRILRAREKMAEMLKGGPYGS